MSKLTEQQRRAVESIESNVLVSAGAGSGKTHVLVERYVEILRKSPDLSAADLIAVTYTKKAAREMRMRVKMRMETLVRQASSGEEQERWARLRQEVDHARIGTIHSLCESLLKAFPAEAGVDPQFQVLDDLEAAELLDGSIELALLGIDPDSTGHLELMESYPIDTIKEWVRQLMRSSLQFEAAQRVLPSLTDDALGAHVEGLLIGLWRSAAQEIFDDGNWNSLLEAVSAGVLDEGNKLLAMRRDVLGLARTAQSLSEKDADLKECIGCLRALTGAINLKVGGRDDVSKAVKAALKSLRSLVDGKLNGVPDCLVETDMLSFSHVRALIEVTERALANYDQAKSSTQKLDFNDLIRRTHSLLGRTGSAARSYYNSHTAAVLVDEFQDTNTIQAELLEMLAGPSTRLFLIGDDKQSIYKFQGADVSTFNAWKDYFQKDGERQERQTRLTADCAVERLEVSFRSHPQIVGFVNAVFENLLAAGNTPVKAYEARHQALQSARPDEGDGERVEIAIFDAAGEDDKSDSQLARVLEARAVASWIQTKISQAALVVEKTGGVRPIEFGDFAILVQRNGDFKVIERELARAGIPYVAAGGAGFLERQEVLDLENLLRFLSCPTDSHSLFGVLRSPLFAVSDDVLHGLASREPGPLWSAVQSAAAQGGAGYVFLRPVVAGLKHFQSLSRRVRLPDLLRIIIRDTSYDIALAAVPNSQTRSRNLWKLVAMASQRADMSPAEFAHCLQSMRELKVKQTLAPVDSGNSVKLMTIHGSKGLEFPAVIVPVMGVDAARVPGKLRCHRDYGIALDCTRNGEEKPAFFRAARAIESKMAVAEGKRLLYVAMTRARDYLALFVDRRGREVTSFRGWLDDVLALDLAGDGVEAGPRKLQGRTAVGKYVVSHFDPQSLQAAREPSPPPASTAGAAFMRTDLLEPVDPAMIEATDSWQERARVTPAPSHSELPHALAGRFFHSAMERFCQRLEILPRTVLEDVACSEAIGVVHPQLVGELVQSGERLLEKFYASPLCVLMRGAKTIFSEPPYALVAPDRPHVSRRPDLLLADAQGQWHVIDFKTDRFAADQMEKQANSHRRQLETYADDIKALTKVQVRKSVYFAEHGELHFLDS